MAFVVRESVAEIAKLTSALMVWLFLNCAAAVGIGNNTLDLCWLFDMTLQSATWTYADVTLCCDRV